jgi:hypothetical protein
MSYGARIADAMRQGGICVGGILKGEKPACTRLLHRLTAGNGTSRTSEHVRLESAKWAKADIEQVAVADARD